MRWVLTAVLLATGGVMAAPVPANDQAEQRKLETLWAELDAAEPVPRLRAAFALLDHPKAVPFLAEKLPRIEATADQLKGWLRDLDSDDEKVWQSAYERLGYFNPQLAFTPAEQLALVTTDNGRRMLYGVWSNSLVTFGEGTTYRTELALDLKNPTRPLATIKFHVVQRSGQTVTNALGTLVDPLEESYTAAWNRAMLASHVLARINTKESRVALERLASGHKNAKPTRTAALLKAKDEKFNHAEAWAVLLYLGASDGFDAVGDLIDAPDAAKFLKAKLPAIKASKEQMTGWLKALDDEDPKVWKPAFEKVLYFRPRIALDWQEQIDTVTTAHGRTALFQVWETFVKAAPDKLKVDPGCTLGIEVREDDGRRLKLHNPDPKVKGFSETIELHAMDEMFSYQWRRVRVAVVALERMKSDEAKAVLKQLADGHPDILPTKEAKAALDRLNK